MSAANDACLHDAYRVERDHLIALSNERAFLAWQRAALGLLATALAVEFVPNLRIPGTGDVLGIVLAVIAILTSVAGLLRWVRTNQSIPRRAGR